VSDLVCGPLADELELLASLLGTWRGEGDGDYPTIDAFRYGEELTFDHVGDPFLRYSQESWMLADGTPLHFERGFLRPGTEPGDVELMLAHPLGLTEIAQGRRVGSTMELASDGAVARTRTGSAVTGLLRRYRIEGDEMTYQVDMAMDEVPMTRHLSATLRKIG
jgi:hypothetical protein